MFRQTDYTRGAPANQLDDGIGDTLVVGPGNKVRATLCECVQFMLWGQSIRSSNRFAIVILA